MDSVSNINVVPISIEEEMRSSYLDYAMSVIIGRAIPDVRDGLKPVHRRILYAMYDIKNFHSQPYKKSARIVGDVIGKYHPHGDASVYEALVRMAQEFSMRLPLIDGQGNFGSLDGDPPAAMRYTEVRLAKISDEMLADLEKDTVDWLPNYDDSLKEPVVLSTKVPNLLLNGANGIAVGMATNIPPHNLTELIEATIFLINNPDANIYEIMRFIPGPDFPTGAIIYGKEGIRNAYTTGKGIINIRGRAEIEENDKNSSIIFTEIPYQVNKAKLLEKIAQLVKDKEIEGVSDIRDESDRDGVRVVIELKRDAVPQVILNRLYKLTPLQSSFGIINLAIVNQRPKVLNLKEILYYFIQHRKETVTRRSIFELKEAEKRAHILKGLIIALENIDVIIDLIRKSESPAEAKSKLQTNFKLSLIQAEAILDMRLQRLTGLERTKIDNELKELSEKIDFLNMILSDEKKLMEVIIKELEEIKTLYLSPRKTEIIPDTVEIDEEDLIVEEEVAITVSHLGYIKRTPLNEYCSQKRGGRGKSGMETRDEDFVTQLFVSSNHSWVLFFSDKGRVYIKKAYEIPKSSRSGRGRAIVNFVGMGSDERVTAVLPVKEFLENTYIVTCSKLGQVKKTDLMAYSNIRQNGIIGVGLEEGDELVAAVLTNGTQKLIITSYFGMAIRFNEEQVRPMGRTAKGVKGIELREGDRVVSMDVITNDEKETVFTVCENGFGKRSSLEDYRLQRRGGIGIITIKTSERNGNVSASTLVEDKDEIMIISDKGKIIRLAVASIPIIGRNTMGVRLIKLDHEENVAGAERLAENDQDQECDQLTDISSPEILTSPELPELPDSQIESSSSKLPDEPPEPSSSDPSSSDPSTDIN